MSWAKTRAIASSEPAEADAPNCSTATTKLTKATPPRQRHKLLGSFMMRREANNMAGRRANLCIIAPSTHISSGPTRLIIKPPIAKKISVIVSATAVPPPISEEPRDIHTTSTATRATARIQCTLAGSA